MQQRWQCVGVWALILRLRLFVGAAHLRHRGSQLRHVDEAVRSVAVEGAIATGTWHSCADEGDAISQAGRVRFGWAMSWVESTLPSGASCSILSFGSDPAPSIRKVCECAPIDGTVHTRLREELGVTWSPCGSEGDTCECASGVARFGYGQRWIISDHFVLFSTCQRRTSLAMVVCRDMVFWGEQLCRFRWSIPCRWLKGRWDTMAEDRREAPVGGPLVCSVQDFAGADPASGTQKECWCEQRRAGPALLRARIAIVMLSRRPPDLKLWLEYHLGYMEVEHVFMQVEDTPQFNSTWNALGASQQGRVTVWRTTPVGTGSDLRPADDYETLQQRQLKAMSRAKTLAAAQGIDWLVHIDDDELLYAPLHRPIGEILAAMPQGFDQAYIPNVEAVYPSVDVRNCFAETSEVNMNAFTFASYANGKAAVRVADEAAVPAGPHQWRDVEGRELASIHLDQEPFGAPLLVVHFESCPFARWEDKFWELGNTSPTKVSAIPFEFYRKSIQRMQTCRSKEAPTGGATAVARTAPPSLLASEGCSAEALQRFWAEQKTAANPRLRREDFLPLQIPWGEITRRFGQEA